MRYDIDMAKRDGLYDGPEYESPYPSIEERITKICDICRRDIIVNHWPDKKPRTPLFKQFIVCPICDPRHPEDRYMKTGYRILYPHRLHVIRYAQVTRAMSIHGCINLEGPPGEDWPPENCKCAGCAARKLMPQ